MDKQFSETHKKGTTFADSAASARHVRFNLNAINSMMNCKCIIRTYRLKLMQITYCWHFRDTSSVESWSFER